MDRRTQRALLRVTAQFAMLDRLIHRTKALNSVDKERKGGS